jgi:hypothetical protein
MCSSERQRTHIPVPPAPGGEKGRIHELAERFPTACASRLNTTASKLGPPYIIAGGEWLFGATIVSKLHQRAPAL